MGYRIDYAGYEPKECIRTDTGVRLRCMVAAAFLVFSIAVRMFWPEGTSNLRAVFLPGDLSVTEQAFSQLITDLRQGHSLEDSVTVFCRRILNETT